MVLCSEKFAATVDRGCPLGLGSLGHVMAAKVIALTEAARPSSPAARRIVDNAATWPAALQGQGATVITGGTDSHLLLVDARPYGLTGRQAETALREAGITLNRNVIPFDPNGSWYTSGARIGTPAVTTLGMGAGGCARSPPSSTRSWNPPGPSPIPRPSTAWTRASATRPVPRRRPPGPVPPVPGDRAVAPVDNRAHALPRLGTRSPTGGRPDRMEWRAPGRAGGRPGRGWWARTDWRAPRTRTGGAGTRPRPPSPGSRRQGPGTAPPRPRYRPPAGGGREAWWSG